MKKMLLRFFSCMMALVVLFVSIGWDVKFHYCTVDHKLSGNFSDVATLCGHCVEHLQDHHEANTNGLSSPVAQFDAKCCCDDFEQNIGFSDSFLYSPEKITDVPILPYSLVHYNLQNLIPELQQVLQHFTVRIIPSFNSCRIMLIFYSSLRINPLVF